MMLSISFLTQILDIPQSPKQVNDVFAVEYSINKTPNNDYQITFIKKDGTQPVKIIATRGDVKRFLSLINEINLNPNTETLFSRTSTPKEKKIA